MQNAIHAAIDLVSVHGRRARQVVADHILEAVRNHDMPTAKQWNAVGCAVDERLDKAERRRIELNDNERGKESAQSIGASRGAVRGKA